MKIAVIHPLLRSSQVGGGEQVNLVLAKELGATLFVVSADTHFWNSQSDNELVRQWCGYGYLSFMQESHLPIWRKLKREVGMWMISQGWLNKKLWKQLSEYDIVIFGDDIRWLPRALTKPHKIYYLHTLVTRTNLLKHILKKDLQSVQHVITNSHFAAQRLKQVLDIDSTVIYPPPPVVEAIQTNLESKNNHPYLLYIGRLEPNKNILEMIDLVITQNKYKLIIAGTGSLESKIKNKIQSHNLKNVEMVGYVSGEAKSKFITGSTAGIYLVSEEAFGIAPIEFMQLSRPVIGLVGGVLEETVGHKVGGYLIRDTNDSTGFAQALEWVENIDKNDFAGLGNEKTEVFSSSMFIDEIKRLLIQSGQWKS